jgi:hypothetical protein
MQLDPYRRWFQLLLILIVLSFSILTRFVLSIF